MDHQGYTKRWSSRAQNSKGHQVSHNGKVIEFHIMRRSSNSHNGKVTNVTQRNSHQGHILRWSSRELVDHDSTYYSFLNILEISEKKKRWVGEGDICRACQVCQAWIIHWVSLNNATTTTTTTANPPACPISLLQNLAMAPTSTNTFRVSSDNYLFTPTIQANNPE